MLILKSLAISFKKFKFILSSMGLGIFLILIRFLSHQNVYAFTLIICMLCFLNVIWVLDLMRTRRVWPFVLILPVHLVAGASLSLFEFPNLSFILSLIIVFIVSCLYYINLLVLNVFVVVESRDRLIPLYRVASTWAQILIVVASIPLFTTIFKLPISPIFQVAIVGASSFSLMVFFLWILNLELKVFDLSLAITCTWWTMMLTMGILFIPFEALFRGLFLSSVVLFGLGYIINFMKHTLNRKIILEHIFITIAFLLLGILFIP